MMDREVEKHAVQLRALAASCVTHETGWATAQSHASARLNSLADALGRITELRDAGGSGLGALEAFESIRDAMIRAHQIECERLRAALLEDLYVIVCSGEWVSSSSRDMGGKYL